MRLLLLNLATDAADPVLGFTSSWITALARRVEAVDVLTVRAGELRLPPNVYVHSIGKERGFSRPRRVVEFYRHLGHIVARRRPDACFSHMTPLFTVLAAPVLRARHVPTITWYAHAHLGTTLKLAHHLSAAMVTSLPGAYPYRRDKLTVLAQGIDTSLFTPDPAVTADEPPLILCAGRLSPVKSLETVVEAAGLLHRRGRRDFRVTFVGAPTGERDETYVRTLHERIARLDLPGRVSFQGAVRFRELPAWYRRAAVHLNLTAVGSGDKTALESMACGCLTLVANEDFAPALGEHRDWLLFRPGDASGLADRLAWAFDLPPAARARLGLALREQVVTLHGLDGLADALLDLLRAGTRRLAGAPVVPRHSMPGWPTF